MKTTRPILHEGAGAALPGGRAMKVMAIAASIVVAAFAPTAMAKMSKAILSDSDGVIVGGSPSVRSGIKIEAIENDHANKPAKDVAWLGIATDETCEVLAAQLGLK